MTLSEWSFQLWNTRLNRDFSAFETLFAQFKKQVGDQPEWILEQQLLQAALDRSAGRILESQRILLRIKDALKDPTRATLQIGLNYFSQGEELLAWPYFTEAADKSPDLMTRVLALGNLVICLNHLGLDHKKRLAELEMQFSHFAAIGGAGTASIGSQCLAQRMRDEFRAGDWKNLFEQFDDSLFQKGQPNFMIAWISQLPFVPQPKKDLAWIQSVMMHDTSMLLQNPRIQTVLGIHDRSLPLHFHDRVDRIYLWLWQHLVNSNPIPLEWIMHELELLTSDKKSLSSVEDLRMLRNALGWLQVLEGRNPQDWTQRLGLVGRDGQQRVEVLFESEWKFIQSVYNHVFGQGLPLASMKASDEHTQFFKVLLLGDFSNRLEVVKARMVQSSELRLFCKDGLFMCSREQFYHPQLAQLFCLFQHETSLSFDRITREVFGSDDYSDDLHAPQIHRLLLKARKILGANKAIVARGSYLIKTGEMKIVIVDDGVMAHPRDFKVWKKLCHCTPEKNVSIKKSPRNQMPEKLIELAKEGQASRLQIEEKTGWSKATANRRIDEGLKKGWLTRRGQGAKVVYEFKVNLQ